MRLTWVELNLIKLKAAFCLATEQKWLETPETSAKQDNADTLF